MIFGSPQWRTYSSWIIEVTLGNEPRLPAVFLDRDGVIIVEKHFMADPLDIEFISGSVEGLLNLNSAYRKVVVSNQSGIARGYFSLEDAETFNKEVEKRLNAAGVKIDAWYLCPHGPDDRCECRKPRSGLISLAALDLSINLAASWIVGDKSSDIGAGVASGLKTILVKTGYGGMEPGFIDIKPDFVADNLHCAINIINKGKLK